MTKLNIGLNIFDNNIWFVCQIYKWQKIIFFFAIKIYIYSILIYVFDFSKWVIFLTF